MKKNLFRVLFISFFLFFLPINAKAENFTIENYDVSIKVQENNVYQIKEKIDVLFTYSSHGIKRKIPINNKNYRKLDGKGIESKYKAKISNVKVNNSFETYVENGYYYIKIGNPNDFADEYTSYEISYTYDLGDDNIDEYDDVYYNIIGNDWATSIKNVQFKIEMPKKFDENKINFTIGTYGATYNEAVKYYIDDNTITGMVIPNDNGNALESFEGLTVRMELEEGYFKGERPYRDLTLTVLLTFSIGAVALIIISTILFVKYGYRKKDLLVPEYIVPDNLTPSEAGYLYKGKIENKQIVSLIIYLANKGYIEIIDDKKGFKLKKLKNEINEKYPDYVKITFNGLFKKANADGIVTKNKLKNSFYKTLEKANLKLKKTHVIYNKSHNLINIFYIILLFIPLMFIFMNNGVLTYRKYYNYSTLYYLTIILMIIIFVTCILFIIFNKKREEDATKYYNKLRGFKDYIVNVEEDKINELVLENPNYFYDILPYAYVLGVSNKWSKKFESIIVEPPTWYSGSNFDTFNVMTFNNSLNKTISSAATAMSSRPYESSSSSGSFSGGGGFSGGGSGGGGGSSW